MTVTVYRLTKLRYQDQIFSGPGGLYAAGRWTLRGRPVVYTSGSISLAVLEYTLNYRRRGWVPPSVLGRADPPSKLRDIGQRWLERGPSAVLKVPSAVVVEEWNYLLNPQYADFEKLALGKPKRYQFGRRTGRERRN